MITIINKIGTRVGAFHKTKIMVINWLWSWTKLFLFNKLQACLLSWVNTVISSWILKSGIILAINYFDAVSCNGMRFLWVLWDSVSSISDQSIKFLLDPNRIFIIHNVKLLFAPQQVGFISSKSGCVSCKAMSESTSKTVYEHQRK